MTVNVITPADRSALDTLRNCADKLAPFDCERAKSLLATLDKYGRISPAQWRLVHALARVATGAPVGRVRSTIGDLAPLMALFDRAKARLKRPSLIMGDGTGAAYRLNIAGPNARAPNTVNVVSLVLGTWYGRILATGDFEASPRDATPVALIPALRAFASDPAKAAGAHAKATGRCMFCALAIGEGDDPRARAVGYGEVCARNWGLPFPSKSDARALNTALFAGPVTP